MKNSVPPVAHVHHQLRPKSNHRVRVRPKQLTVKHRELKPGRSGLGVVRVVVAKIQYQPVNPFVSPGQDRAEGVLLLPREVAFVFRHFVGIEVGAIRVIVLEAVDEAQHNNHQHIGNQVTGERKRCEPA